MSIFQIDKLFHFGLFAGITFLALRDMLAMGRSRGYRTKATILLMVLLILYGLGIEHLQENYLNRDGSIADFTADMVGAVFGILIVPFAQRKFPVLFE